MDIVNLLPDAAKLLGIQPSTLLLILIIITTTANRTARLIPDNATGWKGVVRMVCAVIGVNVASRIAPGITVTDVAKAALATPPIPDHLDDADFPPDSRARSGNDGRPTRLVDPGVLHREISAIQDGDRRVEYYKGLPIPRAPATFVAGQVGEDATTSPIPPSKDAAAEPKRNDPAFDRAYVEWQEMPPEYQETFVQFLVDRGWDWNGEKWAHKAKEV